MLVGTFVLIMLMVWLFVHCCYSFSLHAWPGIPHTLCLFFTYAFCVRELHDTSYFGVRLPPDRQSWLNSRTWFLILSVFCSGWPRFSILALCSLISFLFAPDISLHKVQLYRCFFGFQSNVDPTAEDFFGNWTVFNTLPPLNLFPIKGTRGESFFLILSFLGSFKS